ncbi:hypothetical protein OJF2_75950 [Aquisphaera giovannonii]|uniref:Uncharacterized protein n=1 Tax=Aquisphaera giovannonii TaxID=406548 RepID=A0A5B9WET6_9BACT|nr:hypothetical protein [Aquisphaera giovannonii]QEH38983.1 hypothetical protein OJF2_75950 [Aquisphaera giovannonii]
MPPPRVRFTMRQMMVIVAILAAVIGTVEGLRRRRESFNRRAELFAQKGSAAIMDEQNYRMSHRTNRRDSPFYYDNRTSAAYDRLVEHYDEMRTKYERAAARPWWFVEPDRPEPDWPKGVPKR